MSKFEELKNYLRIGTAAATIAAVTTSAFAGGVYAQDDEDEDEEEMTEEITVTGSRIKRSEFTSASPVQIITPKTSSLAGLVDPAEILQSSTAAANSNQINNFYSGFVTGGGPGANTISLRGFGATRSLVLLNGRRLNPVGTRGQVATTDLNTLPNSAVQRYEILKDGASSIYGSDAIAGVVNIITRTDLEGIEVNFSTSQPFAGGGSNITADLVWGTTSDDSSIMFGVDFYKQEELNYGQRDWASCPREYYFDPDTGEETSMIDTNTGEYKCWGAANNYFVVPLGNFWFGAARWIREGGQADDGIQGYRPGSLAERNFYNGKELKANLISSVKRLNIYSFGQKDLEEIDGAEVFYEFTFNKRESVQNSGTRQFAPRISPDHPNNPWGDGLNDAVDFLAAVGFGDYTASAYVLPLYIMPYEQESDQEVNSFRALAGIRGDFTNSVLSGWNYDLAFGYSKSHGTYGGIQILGDRVTNASNVVINPETGELDCAINLDYTYNAYTGPTCVPLNPFYTNEMVNMSDELLNYLTAYEQGSTTYDQYLLTGYMSGTLFDLPAGPVGAVVGFEWRRESINDVPGPNAQRYNLWGFTSAGITKGTDTVKEAYTEIDLPLVRGKKFMEDLTLSASARYTDYDSTGDDITYKAGLNWTILPQLRLRGSFGTSFRAPALYENFLGGQTAFTSAGDPCENYGEDNEPTDFVYINCASEGLAPDFAGYNGTPRVITFGNEGRLEPETSESLTVGAVATLDEIGLNVAVDYWDISISGQIDRYGASAILSRCYNSEEFRTPGTICDFITPRDSTGNIEEINDSYFNIESQKKRGIDLTVRYTFDVKDVAFDINANVTRILEESFDLLGENERDFSNIVGSPEMNGNLSIGADYKEWTFFYNVRFIGEMNKGYEYYNIDPTTSEWILDTPNVFYHDVSASYEHESGWYITAGISNLFDKEPPFVSDVLSRLGNGAFYTGYDVRGRRAFMNIGTTF